MKVTQSRNITSANTDHSGFFQKESRNNFFGRGEAQKPFFNANTIQAKLTIGQPNDPYEKEADAMADTVVQRLSEPNTGFTNKNENIVQAKPIASPITPFVQTKCAACEQEEKLQKKEDEREDIEDKLQKKPIFESNAEPPEDENNIQRKCAVCEKEDEKKWQTKIENNCIQNASSSIEATLNSSKGSGNPLPDNSLHQMESSFGADLSDVRIHTDSSAVQMSKDVQAQAFTHGSDIYFNSGKYDVSSTKGQHLLAHELTHTMQQKGSLGIQAANKTYSLIQRFPKAAEIPPTTKKQRDYYSHRDDFVDIKGVSKFNPNTGLGNYIASRSEAGSSDIAVNVKFGSLGENFIFVKLRGYYINFACIKRDRTLFSEITCADVPPASTNYFAQEQVIPIRHEAFRQSDKGTPVIVVAVNAGIISGKLGWIAGKKPDEIDPLMRAETNEEVFLPLIYGSDYDPKKFIPGHSNNKLADGKLSFHSLGELLLEDDQKLQGIFYLNDEKYKWQGNIPIKADGLEATNMPVDRDDRAQLLANLPSLQLNKTWTGHGITASIHASYIHGVLEIIGTANYTPTDKSSRIKSAEATVMVVGRQKAWDEVRQHLPNLDDKAAADLPGLYKGGEGLALIGWGYVQLSLVKKQDGTDLVVGKAGLVLDPDGFLTVSGTIRVENKYKLMDAQGLPDWKPIHPSLVKEFGPFFLTIPGVPAGLNFTGKGGLYYKYVLGPITLHGIAIQGVYSTNPKINKELSVSGILNISAELQGKVDVTGRMAARAGISFPYLGVDVAAVELNVIGEASLKSYLDVASTFGMREVSDGGAKATRAFMKGTIQLAGELSLGLSGKLHFEVLYGKIADTSISGNWPVANAGAALDFDYNIGDKITKEKLAEIIKPKKVAFDREKFVKGIVKNKTPKETHASKGGFIDDKGKKIAEGSDKPIPIPEQVVNPTHIKEDFNMEGEWHILDIEIGASGGEVKLMMATNPEFLSKKIRAQRDNTVLRRKVEKDESKQKELDQMIADLDELQKSASQLIFRAQQLGLDPKDATKNSIPGFINLSRQIAAFGRRYKLNNLGATSGGPSGGTKPSKTIGDGSYDYPIRIRWVKRGYHSPISLQPLLSRWKTNPPPDIVTDARYDSKTKIEIPPTQKGSFSEAKKEERNGQEIFVVEIGVDPGYQSDINKRIKRTKSSNKRSTSAKFRTLLASYRYDWKFADPQADHALDLGWGGPDDLDNVWPLYKGMNKGGNDVYQQSVEYIENGEVKKGIPYELVGKWFIIDSIGDTF